MSAGRIPTTANSPLTTKGDLFSYSTQPARLAVGSDGDTLVADSSAATGLKWAAPASSSFVGVLCRTSGAQSIPNTTDTVLNFPGADWFDTDGFHSPSTNNSRITIPAGLGGYYLIFGTNTWDVNSTGRRFCEITLNGTSIFTANGFATNAVAAPSTQINVVYNLAAGDYVEYRVWQSSGGNLNNLDGEKLTWFGVAKQ